jgi:Peptidase S24-like
LAHLLQTPPSTMIAEGSRSSPTAELVASFLRDGIDVRVRLSGWSMKPLVPSGSLVRFSRSGKLSMGDVVLARLPNDSFLAHRIVGIEGNRIWTKGDACLAADGPISRTSVIGRAVSREGFISLPLSNVWMRAVGLIVSHLYPRLVAGYRVLLPRGESAT